MAALGGEQQISSTVEQIERNDSREGSAERKWCKDREEKLRLARERQDEERKKKIDELKAQAEAAQKYREQKEEERRRRLEEIRVRDNEKRHQVEERKRAILEAEKERREYILRKNQEREARLEHKKRERNSMVYAFGSSTPRLLEPADFGLLASSTYWGQRRSTSISNMANSTLSRRSSERELNDSGCKKRAASANISDKRDVDRRKSSSMYEVFNWGFSNDEPPKRFSLSIAGGEINIDDEPTANLITASAKAANARRNFSNINLNNTNTNTNNQNQNYNVSTTAPHRQYSEHHLHFINNTNTNTTTGTAIINKNNDNNRNLITTTATSMAAKDDNVDSSQFVYRSVARRKTDLMPTIPTPRDGHYGSRSSLSTTPRTPVGRAFSMNRLDQLATPIRRHGEHIAAIHERERRERDELLEETESLGGGGHRYTSSYKRSSFGGASGGGGGGSSASKTRGTKSATMSRSMTHLSSSHHHHQASPGINGRPPRMYSVGGGILSSVRPLGQQGNTRATSKSMTQLTRSWSTSCTTPPTPRSNLGLQTSATKKYLQSSLGPLSSTSFANKRGQQHFTNPYRFDTLLMTSPNLLVNTTTTTGSRSGNVTPGGTLNHSRPGSAMSTSTTMSTSNYVPRRSAPVRKPRPASIAGTMSLLDGGNSNNATTTNTVKPPAKNTTASVGATGAQNTTPKRANLMTSSMIVTSSTSTPTRSSSAEKKTPAKKDPVTPKPATPKQTLTKTHSSERLTNSSKASKDKAKDILSRSTLVTSTTTSTPTSSNNINKVSEVVQNASTSLTNEEKEQQPSAGLVDWQTEEHKEKAAVASEIVPAIIASIPPQVEPLVAITTEEAMEEQPVAIEEQRESTPPAEPVQKRETSPPATAVETRELTPPSAADGGSDAMTASMIARSKITTEEEAKAALAERRRLAREEAERQAELERQRLEAERLAELKRQEEEAERQRKFEEEANRLAEEQRKAEEERLRQAIEEAKQREEEERLKREEEERQRVEREELERKAKEEAEKQRILVAERLKREEKEREERRKRVEAIMARTRKAGGPTPTKDTNNETQKTQNNQQTEQQQEQQQQSHSDEKSAQQSHQEQQLSASNESDSTSGSVTTTTTTPTSTSNSTQQELINFSTEPQNTQAMYEQTVAEREAALLKNFSGMIIDENVKNFQQQQQQIASEFTNGLSSIGGGDGGATMLQNLTAVTVANGNGHYENINNKNNITVLQGTVASTTNPLIDLSINSQVAVNYNNNNNNNNNNILAATTTTATPQLVNADSHENKDLSLL